MCSGSAARAVWSRRFAAAQTMHSYKCNHVKFLLALSKNGRSLEPWLYYFTYLHTLIIINCISNGYSSNKFVNKMLKKGEYS